MPGSWQTNITLNPLDSSSDGSAHWSPRSRWVLSNKVLLQLDQSSCLRFRCREDCEVEWWLEKLFPRDGRSLCVVFFLISLSFLVRMPGSWQTNITLNPLDSSSDGSAHWSPRSRWVLSNKVLLQLDQSSCLRFRCRARRLWGWTVAGKSVSSQQPKSVCGVFNLISLSFSVVDLRKRNLQLELSASLHIFRIAVTILVYCDSVWGLDRRLMFSVSCLWFGRLSFQTHRSSVGFASGFRSVGLTK